MKQTDKAYDLDTEIAKYGGRISGRIIPVDRIKGADLAVPPRFDLDAEIARYGGIQATPQPATRANQEDPLAVIRQSDPATCQQVEVFVNGLGASVDLVVPRGTPDPRMADSLSCPRWERRRLDRVFRDGRITTEQAREREANEQAERVAFLNRWRMASHGWAKWCRWRRRVPVEADKYRREHEDGQIDWLLELAARRTPLGRTIAKKKQSEGAIYELEKRASTVGSG
jgi:hypothetical protein